MDMVFIGLLDDDVCLMFFFASQPIAQHENSLEFSGCFLSCFINSTLFHSIALAPSFLLTPHLFSSQRILSSFNRYHATNCSFTQIRSAKAPIDPWLNGLIDEATVFGGER